MTKKVNDFGVVFWVHLATLIVEYASPFLFSWKIVLIGAVALYLQWLILGNCFLTIMQFHTTSKDASCNYYYLTKMGFNVNKKILFRYLAAFPILILITALLWQVVFHRVPVFH